MPGAFKDASYVSLGQTKALVGAVARELCWGLRAVSREVEVWRGRAATIPDHTIREDALSSLESKRGNTDGAALFCCAIRATSTQSDFTPITLTPNSMKMQESRIWLRLPCSPAGGLTR